MPSVTHSTSPPPKECDGCIAYYTGGAAMKGASRDELAEVLAVALLMNRVPAGVYSPRAWAAFDAFAPPSTAAAS